MRALWIAVGALLLADALLAGTIGSWNLGAWLPALLGLPLLLFGLFYEPLRAFTAQGLGRALKILCAAGYVGLALCVGAASCCIARFSAQAPQSGADAVIVLGASLRGERPSPQLCDRLDAALLYLEENPRALVVVCGGQGADEVIPEAEAMARYLVERGLDEGRIRRESGSASTLENLQNARAILEAEGLAGARCVLVSSDYHLLRASLVARKAGLKVETLGCKTNPWLVPNCYLRETAALLGYLVLGRL